MTKILWHSNAAWAPTGYGQQTDIFTSRLRNLGHDVAVSAFWGLNGASLEWDGMKVYPSDDAWGNRLLGPYAAHHAGTGDPLDCQIITLMDVWVLTASLLKDLRIASWCPVDHDPLPPKVHAYFEATGAAPIAMSRFGERMMCDVGLTPVYVPHGVDTKVYRPIDRELVREMMGVPEDAFLVGMVANNKGVAPPRKAFPQALEAFSRLRKQKKDAMLYLHCERLGVHDGLNLVALAKFCDIPEDAIVWAPQFDLELGIPQEAMAGIYSSMDVLLAPSYGEGFGIPIVEAQACGVPVIVNDFSAMHELCGAGWLVDGERWYDATQGAFFQIPLIADITDALFQAYDEASGKRLAAREFALAYDADKVLVEHWVPALQRLELLHEARVNAGTNRAARRAAKRAA